MSLIKKSDVKNHISARHRGENHLFQSGSQFRAPAVSVVETAVVETRSSLFEKDFLGEHSTSGAFVALSDQIIEITAAEKTAAPKSAQK